METAVIAVDRGNYDLKFWNGSREPKTIRSVKFKLPRGRLPLEANSRNNALSTFLAFRNLFLSVPAVTPLFRRK